MSGEHPPIGDEVDAIIARATSIDRNLVVDFTALRESLSDAIYRQHIAWADQTFRKGKHYE